MHKHEFLYMMSTSRGIKLELFNKRYITCNLLKLSECTNSSKYYSTVNSDILHMRRFVKLKSSQNDKITVLFTETGKSFPSREFKKALICLLMLFAKMKFTKISNTAVCKSARMITCLMLTRVVIHQLYLLKELEVF